MTANAETSCRRGKSLIGAPPRSEECRHPTIIYGAAILFSINDGEYDIVQMKVDRTFPGSDIDNDVWYFDGGNGHVATNREAIDCTSAWPIE